MPFRKRHACYGRPACSISVFASLIVPKSSRSLPTIPSAQLRPLRNRLRQSIRDAGLTDLSPTSQGSRGDAEFWDLEPSPLVIPASEWSQLSAGIVQRARLVNAFLHDLYHQQEVLREGVVPPDYTLADPYYRRPCLDLTPDRKDPASLIRFDLVKTEAGWVVTETHTNTPVGLSYAVQNRRFLTQEAADYYRALPDYHSIIDAPLQLVDHLRRLSPTTGRRPSMVFLTTGPRYPFFSEHSFLARKTGLRLAQGDDLLVLDNRVYFKTVAGLEPVDVIYRRVHDAHIDPVVFSTDFQSAGIPGLMQCIRAGNVTVANAIGAGVAENRALNAFWQPLARYYLGERLKLAAPTTWLCTDTDHVDAILDGAAKLVLRRTHAGLITQQLSPAPQLKPGNLPNAVRQNPGGFVAQSKLASVPFGRGRDRRHGFRLSVFAFTRHNHVSVVPGGIVNIGPEPHPRNRVGRTTDVVVLSGGRHRASGTLADFETTGAAGIDLSPPGSRSAESLYWLGRYLERAEATARMLGILEDVALEEIPAAERRRWLPLWRGLLAATGHEQERISARTNPKMTLSDDLLWRMTLDRNHPSSLLTTAGAAAGNARELRAFVSPEAGNILNQLDRKLRTAAQSAPQGRNRAARLLRLRAAHQALRSVLVDINACLGSTARTMLQDAGWHFLQIGKQLERATFTANTLIHVLPVAARHATANADDFGMVYRDNPELSALLRMLGSQDAYRRLYHTRSQPLFVAQLLLQQPMAPRSIAHNFRQMQSSLRAISSLARMPEDNAFARAINTELQALTELNLTPFFDVPPSESGHAEARLNQTLEGIAKELAKMHQLLGDHYFSHQASLDAMVGHPELSF